MNEYKYINAYAGNDFEDKVNALARKGWKIIHIYNEPPHLDIILERDLMNRILDDDITRDISHLKNDTTKSE